ncbi:MAG: hypothetical protein ABGY09_07745 [Euryarchaeota archaeon]
MLAVILTLLTLPTAACAASQYPSTDVYVQGVASDHADLLYVVYATQPGRVTVALPNDAVEILKVGFIPRREIRWRGYGVGVPVPPEDRWHRVDYRVVTREVARWGDRISVYLGHDDVEDRTVALEVPVSRVPRGLRDAFWGVLERGRMVTKVLEARVTEPGVLLVRLRSPLRNGYLLFWAGEGVNVPFSARCSLIEGTIQTPLRELLHEVGEALPPSPRTRTWTLVPGPANPPALLAVPVKSLEAELDAKPLIWPNPFEPPRSGRISWMPPVPPIAGRRRRRLALLAALIGVAWAVTGLASANPRIPPERLPTPVLCHTAALFRWNGEHWLLVRLWPGVEQSVYLPDDAGVKGAWVVPADVVLASARVEEVYRWTREHGRPIAPQRARPPEPPDRVLVPTRLSREPLEAPLESVGRTLPWFSRDRLERLTLEVRAKPSDDAFLLVELDRDPGPVAVTVPVNPPITYLIRDDRGAWWLHVPMTPEDWHVPVTLAIVHPVPARREPCWARFRKIRWTEGPEDLHTERFIEPPKPDPVLVLVRAKANERYLVDIVADTDEVRLPKGSTILACGTLPRAEYWRDAYRGLHTPGYRPARYTATESGDSVIVRVPKAPDRLVLIRAVLPSLPRDAKVVDISGGTRLVPKSAGETGRPSHRPILPVPMVPALRRGRRAP